MTAFLLTAALKATLIFSVACLLAIALRRASSSVRYFIWTCALVAALALPPLSLLVRWNVPVPTTAIALTDTPEFVQASPQPVATRSAPKRTPSISWLLPLWLFGTGLVIARLAIGHARVLLSLRRAKRLRNPAWTTVLDEVSARIGLERRVELRCSRETDIPLSYGFLRPAIVLPGDSEEWTIERRRVVLTHELIHTRRLDSLSFLIAQLSCAAYWFHPLAWVALSRFRKEQERSCDDAVVRTGTGQSVYAEHLVSLARSVTPAAGNLSAALGMAETCDLEQRVHALLDPLRNRRVLSRGVCIAALTAIAVCIVPLAAVRAQNAGRASLSGSVYDPSGAAIPKATVMLKNTDKTNQEIAHAGEDGAYHFNNITAGTYTVEVRARGFALYQQPGVTLNPGVSEQLNLKVDIGQISENIDVVAKGTVPQSQPSGQPRRIRVGGNVQATKLLSAAKPIYPADAQSAGIQGTVLLKAVISKEGIPLNVTVINTSVDAGLAKAAMDAVQQWRYQPTLLNGVPVEVITTVTVNFRLEP